MTTHEVRQALLKRFADRRQYVVAEEVGTSTGYAKRRIDMVVMDCYRSNGYKITGIEIKVSTSDLRRELADPDKHIAFFDLVDYFVLAAPQEVVNPVYDIIPKKWGVLIVNSDGTTRYRRKPLALKDEVNKTITRGFAASLIRAIQELQPSEIELNEAYKRGRKEAEEEYERQRANLNDRVANQADKIRKYDQWRSRFQMYGDDIDKVMDEFEIFRNLNTGFAIFHLDEAIKRMTRLSEYLKGKAESGGGENEPDSG